MLTLNIKPYSLIRIFNAVNQTKNKVVFRGYNPATKVEQKKNKVLIVRKKYD